MKIGKLVLSVTAALAIGGSAYAQELQPAMAGHGWPNMFDTCFSSSFAQLQNNCGGTIGSSHLLVVPLQVDGSGGKHAYARAAGNGANGGTDCQAIGIAGDNTSWSFSQIVASSVGNGVQKLDLGNVTIPSGGTLHFECHVAQGGGRVVNVEID